MGKTSPSCMFPQKSLKLRQMLVWVQQEGVKTQGTTAYTSHSAHTESCPSPF